MVMATMTMFVRSFVALVLECWNSDTKPDGAAARKKG